MNSSRFALRNLIRRLVAPRGSFSMGSDMSCVDAYYKPERALQTCDYPRYSTEITRAALSPDISQLRRSILRVARVVAAFAALAASASVARAATPPPLRAAHGAVA